MAVQNAKQLRVYVRAYDLAMNDFRLTQKFPADEKFSLTSQVRRSSRSVCLNLCEAWAKRRYEAHFLSKLTDCDGEINETETALDFAHDCGYLSTADHQGLVVECQGIGKMLGAMIQDPQGFLVPKPSRKDAAGPSF
jgi:four helix bundle protein